MRLVTGFLRWCAAVTPDVRPLPGRPPARPGSTDPVYGPAPDPDDPARPARRVRAICCSGGGIRSAAFSLGGMQGLQARVGDGPSWYDDVDLVTAVSGGSYLAGSLAMVNHHLTPEQRADLPPYAPGSPEDNRLRNHTRYLIEDEKVAAVGALNILYGLLLNLLPILAGVYVTGKLLGWMLHTVGVLTPSGSAWHFGHVNEIGLVAGGIAALGLLLFAGQRLHDAYYPPNVALARVLRAWSLRLFALAACVALAFLAVPWLMYLLSTSRVHAHLSGISAGTQWTGFVATTVGLVGLVKGVLGRFKAKLQTGGSAAPSLVGTWAAKLLRALAPWVGSAVAVGLLLVALVTWTTSAAYNGLQPYEFGLIALALAIAIGWQAFTDINRNSVHAFYRERLASAFAVRRTADGRGAEELPYPEPVRLSDYRHDRPRLIVCAAVNTDEEGVAPSGRGCAPFTFGPGRTGISSGTIFGGEAGSPGEWVADPRRMRLTAEYERLAGLRLITLPAAMAVSGAAVSPAMGRMTRAPIRLLLGLANVRLGLWLPNPDHDHRFAAPDPVDGSFADRVAWQVRQPGIVALLREILGFTRLTGPWVYVTDGGHYENLGLVEALRRGATEVVVFDGSGDPPESWATFGQAVETARADLGVEIDLDPSTMRPAPGSNRAPTLVVEGTCTYPNGVRATLWLCKLALPEKATASWDVFAWAGGHRSFPHDSTAQQLYGDQEFEAYRRLGEVAAQMARALMGKTAPAVTTTPTRLMPVRPAP